MRELVLNRPVHLAGRDAYYETAVKLFRGDLQHLEVGDRLEKCRAIAILLQFAREHATFALRGMDGIREEKLFLRFLELFLDSAQALQVVTKHEQLFVSDRELLSEFLGQNTEGIDRSAAEHHQLAIDLIEETIQLIQMADASFQKLKEKNQAEFGNDDYRPRYQRAYESFLKQPV